MGYQTGTQIWINLNSKPRVSFRIWYSYVWLEVNSKLGTCTGDSIFLFCIVLISTLVMLALKCIVNQRIGNRIIAVICYLTYVVTESKAILDAYLETISKYSYRAFFPFKIIPSSQSWAAVSSPSHESHTSEVKLRVTASPIPRKCHACYVIRSWIRSLVRHILFDIHIFVRR